MYHTSSSSDFTMSMWSVECVINLLHRKRPEHDIHCDFLITLMPSPLLQLTLIDDINLAKIVALKNENRIPESEKHTHLPHPQQTSSHALK